MTTVGISLALSEKYVNNGGKTWLPLQPPFFGTKVSIVDLYGLLAPEFLFTEIYCTYIFALTCSFQFQQRSKLELDVAEASVA